MSESSTSAARDDGDEPVGTSLDAVARELADAVHGAAVIAGRLDEIARTTSDDVDPDTRLRLDQAHSNASAVVSLLTELGYG